MTDPETLEAARHLNALRWAGQRPTRMAREVARRAAEVDEDARAELLAALNRHVNRHTDQEQP